MYSLRFTILVLAASAAAPVLSAPLATTYSLAARDLALSGRDIRHLLANIQARKDFFTKVLDGAGDIVDGTVNDAEDVVTGTAEGFDALGNGIKNAVNQRDYLSGDIQARKDFFTKVLDGTGDVIDGTVNDAEDVVTGTAEGFDALGNGIKNAVNQRDYLAGDIQARKDFFTKVLDGAGDVADGVVNDAEDVVTGTAEGFDALGNGIKNAVNQRDYLTGDIRARNFFGNILNGAEDIADGVVNDAEDVVTGTAEGFDALGNGIKNAVNQ